MQDQMPYFVSERKSKTRADGIQMSININDMGPKLTHAQDLSTSLAIPEIEFCLELHTAFFN